MDDYLCAIRLWPIGRIPRGYLACEGQLLQIKQNNALFALLGTTYGGDGINTFALPDLRGLFPICMGKNPSGATTYQLNDTGGSQTASLDLTQFPVHNHSVSVSIKQKCNTSGGTGSANPQNMYPAALSGKTNKLYNSNLTNGAFMAPLETSYNDSMQGGNERHNNMPPYQALMYIICISGIFPIRP